MGTLLSPSQECHPFTPSYLAHDLVVSPVPLSFSCGEDYEQLRRRIYSRFGRLIATHFSIRPAKLFPNVDQRITIFVAKENHKGGCKVASSKLYRFNNGEQESLVLHPEVGELGVMTDGYIPRVGSQIGASVYKKFKNIPSTVGDYLTDDKRNGIKWWFHSVGRYWLKAYNFLPMFLRGRKHGISSTTVENLACTEKAAIACAGVINSNLFYFWWISQSDEFHVLRSEVYSMPLPRSVLDDAKIVDVVKRLMADYKSKAIRKKIHVGGKDVEMEEIHGRLSRPIILEIDQILAPHYGLSPEEVDFLQNYDLRFRVSVKHDESLFD
jgi:hypothetical protein